jgi:hypothetical protein
MYHSEINHKKEETTKPFSVKKCKLWFEEYAGKNYGICS